MELSDLILLIIYIAGGKLSGKVRLQKLVDLIRLDSDIYVKVEFEPYRFGDFSDEVVNISGILYDNDILDITNQEMEIFGIDVLTDYKLTDSGKIIAEKLYNELREDEIKELSRIKKFSTIPWEILVKCCYFWFPETAKRSEIKPSLFYKKLSDIPNNLLAEEYEKILNSGKTVKELVRAQWKEFI